MSSGQPEDLIDVIRQPGTAHPKLFIPHIVCVCVLLPFLKHTLQSNMVGFEFPEAQNHQFCHHFLWSRPRGVGDRRTSFCFINPLFIPILFLETPCRSVTSHVSCFGATAATLPESPLPGMAVAICQVRASQEAAAHSLGGPRQGCILEGFASCWRSIGMYRLYLQAVYMFNAFCNRIFIAHKNN